MTIPNLISKHQKRTIETKLFKIHSSVLQAIRMAQANSDGNFNLNNLAQETVNVNGFSWPKSKTVFDEYFLPVFKVSHTYPADYSSQLYVYSADGSTKVAGIDRSSYIVALNDGTLLGFVKAGNNEEFYIDVIFNPNKKRLISGKDTFFMKYKSDGYGNFSYKPYKQFNKETLKEYCASKSARPAASIYPSAFCTSLIFQNNFEIPADYPVKI
ncbi:MAG: hypothetical protein NC191_08315 [Muribaculaceae bacterium]|nr:hypothetical protein [Muribaculaceae bacterium]